MTTVDNDPQLNSLLWDEIKNDLEVAGTDWVAYRKVMAERIGRGLENLFAAYLAQHPYVESLAFSLTTAEYDDEGYGGFNFTEIRPRFDHAGLKQETVSFLNSEENEYEAAYIEPVRYGYRHGRTEFPEEIALAMKQCSEIGNILNSLIDFARVHWNDGGIKVTREKISFFSDAEDLT